MVWWSVHPIAARFDRNHSTSRAGRATAGLWSRRRQGLRDAPDLPVPTATTASATPRLTKTATVVALLGSDGGATLAELIAATGWLPHTTRAALTGLRK